MQKASRDGALAINRFSFAIAAVGDICGLHRCIKLAVMKGMCTYGVVLKRVAFTGISIEC